NNMIWNPMSQKSITYKMSDLRLIAGLASYQPAIVATPNQPFKNLQELIAYSKDKSVNVADMGGISKAILAYIAKKEDVKWNLIPTRGGGEMVPFILGGKVDFAYSGGIHQKYPGEMTVLASFLSKPLAYTPEAPSIQDLYGVSQVGNAVLVAPAGLPDDIAAKLEAAGKASLDDPDFNKLLANIKFPKGFASGDDLTALVEQTRKSLEGVLAAIQ
ncbi:MAG: tripartite tricarboxylate transporter substrate-binding protein, partial [Gammaproteobacteria bacterium]